MDRIAFIFGEIFIYWSSIVLTLSVAVAIFLFLSFYLWREGNGVAAAAVIPLAIVLSLVFSRFMHWYCRADSYASFASAMTNYGAGGYALMGAFAGCALAAAVVRIVGITRNLPHLLDCMSLAGCGGIAVGRLACFFNTQDRGQIVASMQELPWVYPVTNSVSGALEYRLATFVIQAMVTGAIFLLLLIFVLATRKKHRDGDTTLVFLLLYSASQVVLDSTRYDSLFFRSNGFVSIVQVLSAMGLGLACILFSIRLVKRNGFRNWYIALWAVFAGLMGLGGYMEYYVQRHGDQPVFAYTWMTTALVGIVIVVMGIRFLAQRDLKPVPPRSEKKSPKKKPAEKPEKKEKKPEKEKKSTMEVLVLREKNPPEEMPELDLLDEVPEEEVSLVYQSLESMNLPKDLFEE